MTNKSQSLDDLFREEEQQLLEKARSEIAQENAEWEALPESEKQRINAEREKRFADIPETEDDHEEDDEEEEDEDEN